MKEMRFYSKANIDLYLFSIFFILIKPAIIQVLLTWNLTLSPRFTLNILKTY